MRWSRPCTNDRRHRAGLVHHSDRGSQYVCTRYTERLAEAGIEPSVGSVGDSYDNALAETINGLYKAEVIHRRGPWRSSKPSSSPRSNGYWFNNRRLLKPIGNIPPAEAEARYYAMLEQPAPWQRDSNQTVSGKSERGSGATSCGNLPPALWFATIKKFLFSKGNGSQSP